MGWGVGREAIAGAKMTWRLLQDIRPGCIASHAVNRYDAAKAVFRPADGGAWLRRANKCSHTGCSQDRVRRVDPVGCRKGRSMPEPLGSKTGTSS